MRFSKLAEVLILLKPQNILAFKTGQDITILFSIKESKTSVLHITSSNSMCMFSPKNNLVHAFEYCISLLTQTRRLKQENSFSHSSGGWRSKIKVSAGLVSSEASLLGCLLAVSSHGICCVVCVLISSSYKDISHIELGPTHITLFSPL